MQKIVKIFHRQTDRPTDKPTPRSSSPELKNLNNGSDKLAYIRTDMPDKT